MRLLGERGTKIMQWALPIGLGLLFGYWAAANTRDGGPITGWNLFFGIMAGLVFMLALMAMRAVAPRLPRGIRALAWAAFTGVAVGFLVSMTGTSVIRSLWLGVAPAVGVLVTTFYRIHTRPTPGGRAGTEPRYPVSPSEDAALTEAYASESFTAQSAARPDSAGGPAATPAATTTATTGSGAPVTAGAPVRPARHSLLRRRRRGGKVRRLTRTLRSARSARRHR
jgi:hypothetical protein